MAVPVQVREGLTAVVAIALALMIGLTICAVFGMASGQVLATFAGAGAFGVVVYLTRDFRLTSLWALLLTLPLNLSKYVTAYSIRGGGEAAVRIEISDVFLMILAAMLAIDLIIRRQPGLRVPKVTFIWLAIISLGMFDVAFATWQRAAAYEVIRMLKVVLLFVVLCNELRTKRRILHAVTATLLGMLFQSIIGAAQFIKRGDLGLGILGETTQEATQIIAQASMAADTWRVSGLLLHPNVFGIYLAVLLPLAIAMFLVARRTWARLSLAICLLMGLMALIMTFSRSGWVSFTVSLGLAMYLLLSHGVIRRRSLAAVLVAAVLLGGIVIGFSGQIASRLFGSKPQAVIARKEMNEDARRLIREKPLFGWGTNSYVDVLLPYSQYTRESMGAWIPPVHNIYYLWWAELGIIGLVLHLSTMAAVAWSGVHNLRIRDPVMFAIGAACLSSLVAFLIDGFFSFSLRINITLRLYWLMAGFILAVHYWQMTIGRYENSPHTRRGNVPLDESPWEPKSRD